MPGSYEYQPTTGHDTDPEDDLDLDELDYATNQNGNPRRSTPWRSSAIPNNIPLRPLQDSSPTRFWQTKNRRQRQAQDDDLEGLLGDGYDEESRGWNVRRSERPSQRASSGLPRRASIRQSLQIPDYLRQELADMRDPPDVSNQDSRDVDVGRQPKKRYAPNIVSNAKYSLWSFLPLTLYNEFRFFLNIYFLLVALSQIVPYLRIGYMSTYIVPLVFVLTISIGKEALDDLARRRRDAEANSELYTVLAFDQDMTTRPSTSGAREIQKKSRDLKVGDVLKLEKNQRVPADVIILNSSSADAVIEEGVPAASVAAETFIRTDQLDGETDWKLRIPCPLSQPLDISDLRRVKITAGAPSQQVNEFVGTASLSVNTAAYDPHVAKVKISTDTDGQADQQDTIASDEAPTCIPLGIDNTAWANTVLASNTTTLAAIIYTGKQTRSAMSTSQSRSKTGLLENEINNLTKILCIMTLTLSVVLVALEGFEPSNKKPWYVAIMIYLILFSTIIPISLRVNLDMGKTVYARFIERDQGIPGTVVRTSTIPEDLGRIEYLLSDKTGTLTQNEMQLKKIHVGTVSYAGEAMEEVSAYVNQVFAQDTQDSKAPQLSSAGMNTARSRREIGTRVRDLVIALALCHNVTPSTEDIGGEQVISYQASSPDEIAIVEFTESVGLRLQQRSREQITLQSSRTGKTVLTASILDIFPFTSDSKRMGIIVRISTTLPNFPQSDDLLFLQKGADTVMSTIVAPNDWLAEETANMARDGLRTLVVGRKRLTQPQYEAFATAYRNASLSLTSRDTAISTVLSQHLEHSLDLLGVTGVQDRLQTNVKPSLELLRNAGVKIWMLTGDKIETARCVAVSSRLVSRTQQITTIAKCTSKSLAHEALTRLSSLTDTALLIDGDSLTAILSDPSLTTLFMTSTIPLPALIACRCSPSQKARLANLLRTTTKSRICCIGDGGNDVPMIQTADIGIGIVGKEGRQASLAADYSVTHFHHITKLLVWHGRNSYKRSAKLAQFIIHRGLIISVCQTMYNIAGKFDPKGLFKDWLLVGYATVYTMAPVFSLVLDRDVDEKLTNLYPELYKELKTGQSLSYKTFFTWVAVSIYQGIVIQGLSQLLVGEIDGPRMLSVSFTVLILNELIMVAVSITTWHPVMIVCILGTAVVYAASVPFLEEYFDLGYVVSWGWVWRVAVVAAISLVPVWSGKVIGRAVRPPSYRKVQGI